MGLLDHRKTWHFSVEATSEQCFQAFHQAMSQPGFKFRAVKWHLERNTILVNPEESPWPASVATYKGRAGLALVGTILVGKRAQDAEKGAMDSQIMFAVNPKSSKSRTECSMWLSRAGTTFGFTNDAGYFRSYMYDVEKRLRVLDSTLTMDKV